MQGGEAGGGLPEGAEDESADPRRKLISIVLDEASIGRGNADQEHERLIAIYDLVECNCFAPSQIEAIDMGRRGLHDEGAALLAERLDGKIECDFDTARRLFTLITALHWKG